MALSLLGYGKFGISFVNCKIIRENEISLTSELPTNFCGVSLLANDSAGALQKREVTTKACKTERLSVCINFLDNKI